MIFNIFFSSFLHIISISSSTFNLSISSIGIEIVSFKQGQTLNIFGINAFSILTASGITSFICCAINPKTKLLPLST